MAQFAAHLTPCLRTRFVHSFANSNTVLGGWPCSVASTRRPRSRSGVDQLPRRSPGIMPFAGKSTGITQVIQNSGRTYVGSGMTRTTVSESANPAHVDTISISPERWPICPITCAANKYWTNEYHKYEETSVSFAIWCGAGGFGSARIWTDIGIRRWQRSSGTVEGGS